MLNYFLLSYPFGYASVFPYLSDMKQATSFRIDASEIRADFANLSDKEIDSEIRMIALSHLSAMGAPSGGEISVEYNMDDDSYHVRYDITGVA